MNLVTTWPKPNKEHRKWWLIDADGIILGRLATKVVDLLTGKYKPDFEKSVDMGDCVVVINADKFKVTGGKKDKKIYYHHTPFPGGIRSITLGEMLEKTPTRALEHAVELMLPKNKMRTLQMARLHLTVGTTHKYGPQKPEVIDLLVKEKSKSK